MNDEVDNFCFCCKNVAANNIDRVKSLDSIYGSKTDNDYHMKNSIASMVAARRLEPQIGNK